MFRLTVSKMRKILREKETETDLQHLLLSSKCCDKLSAFGSLKFVIE